VIEEEEEHSPEIMTIRQEDLLFEERHQNNNEN